MFYASHEIKCALALDTNFFLGSKILKIIGNDLGKVSLETKLYKPNSSEKMVFGQ